ncbi:hypothetical protein K7432_018388 [Basidiobolus ranarum]|uniref:AMP-dependent synthetase/ligase domain-containing protein n=1 Tax=Basidiobolus ranarum TaxID=34480 RepID=A0ABR2WCA2_9FUNG
MIGIHRAQLGQYEHQAIGMKDIIQSCSTVGSKMPFDTLLAIQNLASTDSTGKFSSVGLKSYQSTMNMEFPVVIELSSDGTSHEISLRYNSNEIDQDESGWLLNHFVTAMKRVVQDPSVLVDDLSIITSNEEQLVQSWSSIKHSQPNPICLHTMFEQAVALHPNNIAVQFETSEYVTYAELNQRANQLAHHLIILGVGPETMVPLCLDKSVFMIVAILAVLKAGGAYVPLDPNNPSVRNDFIMEETNAQVVVTISQYKQTFNGVSLILMDEDAESIECNPTNNPVVNEHTESNLCYVLYTSGSTGTPKGVMIEHYAVVNLLFGLQGTWNLTTQDVVLQFANYTFDASVLEIFPT